MPSRDARPRWLDLARDEDLIFRIESKIDLVELNLAPEINQWCKYILLIHSHSAVVQGRRYLHSRIHHDMEGRRLICHCSNVVNLPFTELNFDHKIYSSDDTGPGDVAGFGTGGYIMDQKPSTLKVGAGTARLTSETMLELCPAICLTAPPPQSRWQLHQHFTRLGTTKKEKEDEESTKPVRITSGRYKSKPA